MRVQPSRKERAARRAALRGWAVFPVHWVDQGKCSCGNPKCSNPGKHPLTPHGVKDATTDKSLIRKWWHRYPCANIGIATGLRSGIIVLDVDDRHGGFKSIRQLERKHGPLPDGPTVRTGGGGRHHYFPSPGVVLKSRVGLLSGVDLRADGAYVVGPCSTHASGKDYLWVQGKTPQHIPLPVLPTWLETLLVETKSSARSSAFVIEEGRRNSTLASLAGTMQMRGMSARAIEAALIEENYARCAPPLPEGEVRQIAASIFRYAGENASLISPLSAEPVDRDRASSRAGRLVPHATQAHHLRKSSAAGHKTGTAN
jgi:putative DNA primase/helicase